MSKNKDKTDNFPEAKVDLNPNDEEPLSKKEEIADAKERAKPKEYTIDSFHRPLTDDEEKAFKKLDKDEQKKFIIKRWVQENRAAEKADQHEVSLEDMKEAGLMPQP